MVCGLVGFVIHAHHKGRDTVPFGRSGDDHLLGTRFDMALSSIGTSEQSGGFDHEFDSKVLPGKPGRLACADNVDVFAIHDQYIIVFLVGR